MPVVGTRRKADVGYECNATDRIFVSGKCPDGLVLLPELDGFVRRSFITRISRRGDGEKNGNDSPVMNSSPSIATTVKTD